MFLHIFRYSITDLALWTHREVGLFMLGFSIWHYDICIGYMAGEAPNFSYNDMSEFL